VISIFGFLYSYAFWFSKFYFMCILFHKNCFDGGFLLLITVEVNLNCQWRKFNFQPQTICIGKRFFGFAIIQWRFKVWFWKTLIFKLWASLKKCKSNLLCFFFFAMCFLKAGWIMLDLFLNFVMIVNHLMVIMCVIIVILIRII
jgi:hypothetical protein